LLALVFITIPIQAHSQAEIKFLGKRVIEYGTIKEGKKLNISVPFENIGDETLAIYKIEKTCNCTNVSLKKKLYQKNERGKVLISINTSGKEGTQTIVVQLLTNGKRDRYIIRVDFTVE
jgi:hypothetical protein